MLISIILISLFISIPGFVKKMGYPLGKALIPIYNIYLFLLGINISPILLMIIALGMIFTPCRMFFLTLLCILLPFVICDSFNKGKGSAILCLLFPFIMYPFLGYLGGYYVGDQVEEGTRYFKKHKISFVILILFSFYTYFNFTMIVPTNKLIDKDSVHYVNDLYMSDARIYNNYLDDTHKKLYMEMFNSIKNYKSILTISGDDYNSSDIDSIFSKIIVIDNALLIDHPELINYAGFVVYDNGNNTFNIKFRYGKNSKILAKLGEIRIKRIINRIRLATINMSDSEKIRYVYEWIGDNNTYDHLFTYSSKNQSIYNVFIKHNAVCAGFAKASQVIFQNIGIDSSGIVGESTGPHMWNIVKLDNKYYYYDSTVSACHNDKKLEYYYDGLKQEKMNFYKQINSDWFPKIEEKNYKF